MSQRDIGAGIVAGVVGGLLASWVMNEFMAGPGTALSKGVETPAEQRLLEMQSDGEDATMKVADRIEEIVTGGQHLTHEQREKAGPVVHYAFGALMGGVYGGLAEVSTAATAGFGTTFGSALFAGADLFGVPAMGFSQPAKKFPASSYATPLAAHLVYGATTELVRRLVRRLLA